MFLAKSTDWIRLPPNVLGAIISELLTHIYTYTSKCCSGRTAGANYTEAVFTSIHTYGTYRYTDNAVQRSRPATGNQVQEQEQDKRQRLECFVHRVSTIVLRVSCIVFRVMVASSAPMQQSGAERYLTQAYSKQEQPRASIRVHVLVQ